MLVGSLFAMASTRKMAEVIIIYSLGAVALTTGFTNGVGQIWLDNVNCFGNETRLVHCPRNRLGVHDCVHIEDAGVMCLGE